MKIIEVKFRNFRILMNTQISLDKQNTVIIGKNNSGKSTFLKGIDYAFNSLQDTNGKIFNKISGETLAKIEIILRLDKGDLVETLNELGIDYRAEFDLLLSVMYLLKWEYQMKPNSSLTIKNNYKNILEKVGEEVENILAAMKENLVRKVILIKHTSESSSSEKFIPYNEFRIMEDKDRYIRNYVYHLRTKEPENYTELSSILKDLFFIDDLRVFLNTDTGEVGLDIVKDGLEIDVNEMGRGFQYAVLILTKIWFSKFKIVLIDEPDTNMHVNLIRSFIRTLLSHKEIQIVLSTHNDTVINEVDVKNIRYMKMNNYFYSGFDSSKINTKEILSDLGITISNSELARIVNSDAIILCEGADDKKYLPLLISKTKHKRILDRISFIYTGGKAFTNTEIMTELLKSKIPVLLVRDRDENDQEDIENKKKNLGCELYYLKKREIENYALNYNSLLRMIKEKNRTFDLGKLKQQIFVLADDLKIKTILMKTFSSNLFYFDRTKTTPILDKIGNQLDAELISNVIFDQLSNKIGKNEIKDIVQKNIDFIHNEWNIDNILSICPGKQLREKISLWLQTEFGLEISKQDFFDNLEENEIDADILELIAKIESLIETNEQNEREKKKENTSALLIKSNHGGKNV